MRGATPDFGSHTGYKGVRRGEVINSDVLMERFGGDYSFNVGITETGQVMVENLTPDETLSVMRAEAPVASSEIDEEARPRVVKSDFEDMHKVAETAVDFATPETATPEQEHEPPSEEVIEESGEAAMIGAEIEEPISPAQQMRDRIRSAMGASDEGSVQEQEKPKDKEPLISDEDGRLAERIIHQMATVEDGFRNQGAGTTEEAEHHRKKFIGGVKADLEASLKAGNLSREAYVFINGALIGAGREGSLINDLLKDVYNSGSLSEDELTIIHSHLGQVEHTLRAQGREDQDTAIHHAIFDLEQAARVVRERNGDKTDASYLALIGMITGLSTQLNDSWTAGQKISGATSHIRHLKD